jgi:hypothetical protein
LPLKRPAGRSHVRGTTRLPTLHVHLDESGDLRFDARGTRHYIFAVTWTYDPLPLAQDLTALRFALTKQGHDLPSFHACEDDQAHRDAVVRSMNDYATWRYAALVIEKRKVNPSIRDPLEFYPKFAAILLSFVFRGNVMKTASPVLIYTDRIPFAKHKAVVEIAIKKAANKELGGRPFQIFHHPRESNAWIQATDYCAWAVYRKWEGQDSRTYDQLAFRLAKREIDICSRGDGTTYY